MAKKCEKNNAEALLLKRLEEVRDYDKSGTEKVADYNRRKLYAYMRWAEQVEIYLLGKGEMR